MTAQKFSGIFTDRGVPLVVDLDGTLIKSDLLHEGLFMLIKKNPIIFFQYLVWLLKGKVYFKKQLFKLVHLKYHLLPFNQEILSFLQQESESGRQIVMATASLTTVADKVAEVHPLFSKVYGTEEINLKGVNKANLLLEEFGQSKFDYIGNSVADIPVFICARYSYIVRPSRALKRKARKIAGVKYIWNSSQSVWDFIKAIRVYQWLKNLLIFIPVITSHQFFSAAILSKTLAAFFAFSFIASAGYIFNDIADLNSDRGHPKKKFRPLASGKISLPAGVILMACFLLSGLIIAFQLNLYFLISLLVYLAISISYSFFFKKLVLYDVFILTVLYSSRIIAGGLVTGIIISSWLIAFSTFIFISLAFVKRYSELMKVDKESGLKERRRGYVPNDLIFLQTMGIGSGLVSTVVFSLYIDSPDVILLYKHPKLLWITSLFFLFWISHIWIITSRGRMTDDPIIFSVKDPTSYIVFAIILSIMFLAT
ncbi:MAG TPA: UbiA family prenyltransferase [Chitinophagaceae bacterium]|nr:UbiA family prenyltransferase [Chitinophagaceae bacterium]